MNIHPFTSVFRRSPVDTGALSFELLSRSSVLLWKTGCQAVLGSAVCWTEFLTVHDVCFFFQPFLQVCVLQLSLENKRSPSRSSLAHWVRLPSGISLYFLLNIHNLPEPPAPQSDDATTSCFMVVCWCVRVGFSKEPLSSSPGTVPPVCGWALVDVPSSLSDQALTGEEPAAIVCSLRRSELLHRGLGGFFMTLLVRTSCFGQFYTLVTLQGWIFWNRFSIDEERNSMILLKKWKMGWILFIDTWLHVQVQNSAFILKVRAGNI